MTVAADRSRWLKEASVADFIVAARGWLNRPPPGSGDVAALARWTVAALASRIALSSPAGFTSADVPKDGETLAALEKLQVAMTNELVGGATAASLRTYLAAQLLAGLNVVVS